MYISEISPVSVKGAVGVSHQFMITFGILLGFAMSVKQVFLDLFSWKTHKLSRDQEPKNLKRRYTLDLETQK